MTPASFCSTTGTTSYRANGRRHSSGESHCRLQRVDACYENFARDTFGEANPEQLRIAQFVLADVPKAAVIPHLRRRESPPPVVDELIRLTYRAIVQRRPATNRRNIAEGKK